MKEVTIEIEEDAYGFYLAKAVAQDDMSLEDFIAEAVQEHYEGDIQKEKGVTAHHEWERIRLQQAKERKRKMEEQRKLTVRISNYTKTSEFSELYKLIEEAEKEAEERKLDAEINIAIELSSNKRAN